MIGTKSLFFKIITSLVLSVILVATIGIGQVSYCCETCEENGFWSVLMSETSQKHQQGCCDASGQEDHPVFCYMYQDDDCCLVSVAYESFQYLLNSSPVLHITFDMVFTLPVNILLEYILPYLPCIYDFPDNSPVVKGGRDILSKISVLII